MNTLHKMKTELEISKFFNSRNVAKVGKALIPLYMKNILKISINSK